MNGSRSTYMRKGYLLTALAAAVLLAASSGTAWAQSIGFDMTSGSVMETAFVESGPVSSKHPPLEITVRVSGLPAVGDVARLASLLGTVNVSQTSGSGGVLAIYRVQPTSGGRPQAPVALEPTTNIAEYFVSADEVTLRVAPNASTATRDDDWVDDDVVITLSANAAGVVSSPNQAIVTITDEDVAPVVKFGRTGVLLTEDSDTSVAIDVESGSRVQRIPTGLNAEAAFGDLRLSVSNPAIVSVDMACETDPKATAYGRKALSISAMRTDDAGAETGAAALVFDNVGGTITFTELDVGDLAGPADRTTKGGGIKLMLQACGDNDFRDMDFALAFVASRLASRTLGSVVAGDSAMISIRSNDATPTVGFFPTDVFIDEGGEHDVILSATGENSADVMMATLRVEHDETDVGLYYKGGDKIEPNADGTLTVKIKDGQVRLTAMSYSDPDLMDGDMAKKTWIIMSADGAEVGEGYWYTVNVSGSTAVPALPLVGQLLLALFLMAGGARLYRRRQG